MGAKAVRQTLATAAAAALPDDWTVYAAPPTVVAGSALVIGPRDPYIRRVTYRQHELALRLSLMVPLALGADALDVLDDAVELLRPAVLALSTVAWQTVGGLGLTDVGDVQYLMAAVDLTALYDPEV